MRPPLLLMILCALAISANAGPLEDARAAYDRGKYAVALDLWQPLAEQGNPDAQAGIGSLYLGGYGVAADETVAMSWFRKAADQGHAISQLSLANIYSARKNYSAAASWYRRSADQGNVLAEIRLARMYTDGLGLARDDVQAFKWFSIAAAHARDGYTKTNASKGRDAIAAKMSPAQVGEAERLAREWTPKPER